MIKCESVRVMTVISLLLKESERARLTCQALYQDSEWTPEERWRIGLACPRCGLIRRGCTVLSQRLEGPPMYVDM